jgi:hypothetical protein
VHGVNPNESTASDLKIRIHSYEGQGVFYLRSALAGLISANRTIFDGDKSKILCLPPPSFEVGYFENKDDGTRHE